jgi:hypothetical protein
VFNLAQLWDISKAQLIIHVYLVMINAQYAYKAQLIAPSANKVINRTKEIV